MVTDFKFVQREKQLASKLVTCPVILIEAKLEQSAKQLFGKLVTDEGMTIEVNPEQPLYLLSVDYQYYTL